VAPPAPALAGLGSPGASPQPSGPLETQFAALEDEYRQEQAQLAEEYLTQLTAAQDDPTHADWAQIRTTYLTKSRERAETYRQARQSWQALYRQLHAETLRQARISQQPTPTP
jgi:hypothetical protein